MHNVSVRMAKISWTLPLLPTNCMPYLYALNGHCRLFGCLVAQFGFLTSYIHPYVRRRRQHKIDVNRRLNTSDLLALRKICDSINCLCMLSALCAISDTLKIYRPPQTPPAPGHSLPHRPMGSRNANVRHLLNLICMCCYCYCCWCCCCLWHNFDSDFQQFARPHTKQERAHKHNSPQTCCWSCSPCLALLFPFTLFCPLSLCP